MAPHGQTPSARSGQRVALIVAATGVLWTLAIMLGQEYNWSLRTRAFFDLAALAGFGFALWQTFQLWQARRSETTKDKGDT